MWSCIILIMQAQYFSYVLYWYLFATNNFRFITDSLADDHWLRIFQRVFLLTLRSDIAYCSISYVAMRHCATIISIRHLLLLFLMHRISTWNMLSWLLFIGLRDETHSVSDIQQISASTMQYSFWQLPSISTTDTCTVHAISCSFSCFHNNKTTAESMISRHTIVGRAAKSGARQTSVYYTGTK